MNRTWLWPYVAYVVGGFGLIPMLATFYLVGGANFRGGSCMVFQSIYSISH